MVSLWLLPLLPALVFADCPHGFENLHYQNSCYMFVKNKLTWNEADMYCRDHTTNAHLAKIESEGEQRYITDYLKRHQGEYDHELWLDGTDKEEVGVWVWDYDYQHLTYQNWRPNPKEPNNQGGNEHCMEYGLAYGYHWNDIPCTSHYQFICEVAKM